MLAKLGLERRTQAAVLASRLLAPARPDEPAPDRSGQRHAARRTRCRAARPGRALEGRRRARGARRRTLRSPLSRRLGAEADAVVGDGQHDPSAVDPQLDSARVGAARAGRRWTAPRAARPAAASRDGVGHGGVDRAGGPPSGVKPSTGAYSSTSSRTSARSEPVGRSLQLEDRAADVRIVASRSSTAASSRSRTSACRSAHAAAPCSCRPVANSRWITRSCRSRAIRSRSAITASSARSSSAWARSRASAAWSAKRREQLALLVPSRPGLPCSNEHDQHARRRPGGRAAAPRPRARSPRPSVDRRLTVVHACVAGRSTVRRAPRTRSPAGPSTATTVRRRRPATWTYSSGRRGTGDGRAPWRSAQRRAQVDRWLQRLGELGGRLQPLRRRSLRA